MVQGNNNNPIPQQIEQEIRKQMEEMDNRLDRSGWFYLLASLVVLFAILYFFMELNPNRHQGESQFSSEYVEEIHSLEDRLSVTEERLDQLEKERD